MLIYFAETLVNSIRHSLPNMKFYVHEPTQFTQPNGPLYSQLMKRSAKNYKAIRKKRKFLKKQSKKRRCLPKVPNITIAITPHPKSRKSKITPRSSTIGHHRRAQTSRYAHRSIGLFRFPNQKNAQ